MDDLCAEFAAINCMPMGNKEFFVARARQHFAQRSCGGGSVTLLYALCALIVRHTQEQQHQDVAMLALPPKTDEVLLGEWRTDEWSNADEMALRE